MVSSGKKGERGGFSSTIYSSFYGLKNNLVLFLPDILYFLIMAGILVLFAFANNLTGLISAFAASQIEKTEIISKYFTSLRGNQFGLIKLGISILIAFVLAIIIGIKMEATKFYLMKNIVLKKRALFKDAYKNSKGYFWRIFWTRVCMFVIFFIPLFLLLALTISSIALISSNAGKTAVLLLTILAALAIFAVFRWVLLFVYQAMFFEELDTIKSIKKSIWIFKQKKRYTFIAFLLVIAFEIIAMVVGGMLNLASGFIGVSGLLIVIWILLYLTRFFVNLAVNMYTNLFLFFAYPKK